MSEKIYMTYEKIQDYLNHYFSKNNHDSSMFDAIFQLYSQQKFTYSRNTLRLPEQKFSKVDPLYNALKVISIEITPIVRDAHGNKLSKKVYENSFFNKTKDASILLQFQHDKNQLHKHDYFEMNLVLKGTMKITFNKEKLVLKTGDFIIISPETVHQINIDTNSIVVCITIRKSTFDQAFFSLIQNDDVISNFFKYNLYSSKQNYLLFSMNVNYQLLETIQNIFIQSYSNAPQANSICCNYISILLSYGLQELAMSKKSDHGSNLTSKMTSILNCIKNESATITLTQVSQKFSYDKAYLGKLIAKNTGQSFNSLRNYYRIQKSCYLLKFTDYSIEKISIETGYSSPNHYERCFKQIMKQTPTKYRLLNASKNNF